MNQNTSPAHYPHVAISGATKLITRRMLLRFFSEKQRWTCLTIVRHECTNRSHSLALYKPEKATKKRGGGHKKKISERTKPPHHHRLHLSSIPASRNRSDRTRKTQKQEGEERRKKPGDDWRSKRDRNREKHWPANARAPALSRVAPLPEQTDDEQGNEHRKKYTDEEGESGRTNWEEELGQTEKKIKTEHEENKSRILEREPREKRNQDQERKRRRTERKNEALPNQCTNHPQLRLRRQAHQTR